MLLLPLLGPAKHIVPVHAQKGCCQALASHHHGLVVEELELWKTCQHFDATHHVHACEGSVWPCQQTYSNMFAIVD